ncbi:hypothetical protein [Microbacterium aurantiacum]|uniref:Uncharacterized protein n=1 Tax=Microbacterium aurantiacum TaxID=162393 RepID=A0AAJ2HK08_9MICO|nr:hypothetical protein [Microbacterium aurantiacum]MDS0245376.1 hypothetical protein [Microbacterium aurantiacum]
MVPASPHRLRRSTRQAELPAGEVTVTASTPFSPVTEESSATYDHAALSCAR